MNDPIEQFKQAIAAAGLTPAATIIADGKVHRFSTNDKRGDDAGWQVPSGAIAGQVACKVVFELI